MINNEVKAVCRKCKRSASADEFVMDHDAKMMVCPLCVADKRKKDVKPVNNPTKGFSSQAGIKSDKPVDWDKEDEYLEKMAKKKPTEPKQSFTRIDARKISYICPKCKYKFAYDEFKEYPKTCPYCRKPVVNVK
ncbi:MAG: hypothetical protein ABH828_00465 [archaeon]